MSITPNFNFRPTTNPRANALTQNKEADLKTFNAVMNKAIAETKAKIPARVDKASQAHSWNATFSAGGKTYCVTIVPTYYEQPDGTFALTDIRQEKSQPKYDISKPTKLGPNEQVAVHPGPAHIVYCFSNGVTEEPEQKPDDDQSVVPQNGKKFPTEPPSINQSLLEKLRAILANYKS